MTWADRYRFGARTVAAAGYHVFLLHYFDRTGERRASFATLERHFPAWVATLSDAIGFVGRQPGVEPARIGVIGASLGAAVALAAAAEDARIKALVDYFGFVPPGLEESATRLPPTLILHGARDPMVDVSHARNLDALLTRLRVAHETKIYSDQGHGFAGAAAMDAAMRVSGFLARHLGGTDVPALESSLGLG